MAKSRQAGNQLAKDLSCPSENPETQVLAVPVIEFDLNIQYNYLLSLISFGRRCIQLASWSHLFHIHGEFFSISTVISLTFISPYTSSMKTSTNDTSLIVDGKRKRRASAALANSTDVADPALRRHYKARAAVQFQAQQTSAELAPALSQPNLAPYLLRTTRRRSLRLLRFVLLKVSSIIYSLLCA